jgi:hypothetical protein
MLLIEKANEIGIPIDLFKIFKRTEIREKEKVVKR